jgi:hypothetical protein
MKRLALLTVVVAFALFTVAPAFGADAVTDAYGGRGGGVLGAVDSGGNGSPPAQVAESSGSLPFTGADVGLLALGGALLVGVGVGLRRISRPLS